MTARLSVIGGFLAFILLWTVLLRMTLATPASRSFSDDAAYYNAAAVHLLQDGAYSLDGETPTFEREPGYSIFLAGVYALFGSENRAGIYIVQTLLLLVAVGALAAVLYQYGYRRAVWFAAGTLLFHPAILHSLFLVNRELPALVLVIGTLIGSLLFLRRPSWQAAAGTGIACGLLIIVYIPFLFFPLVLGSLLLILRRHAWSSVLVMLLLAYVPIGIWGARNLRWEQSFLGSGYRTALIWDVRARHIDELSPLQPVSCLYHEYVTRQMDAIAPGCVLGGLQEAYPDAAAFEQRTAEARATVFAHPVMHLWFSLFYVLEYHFPFFNGWGLLYNVLVLLTDVMVYAGILLFGVQLFRRRIVWRSEYLLFLSIGLYSAAFFSLLDAIPRYRVPVMVVYLFFAVLGYASAWRHRMHVQAAVPSHA